VSGNNGVVEGLAADGSVFVSDDSGSLGRMNPADGTVHWTYSWRPALTTSNHALLTPDGSVLLVAATDGLHGFNATTGLLKWTYRVTYLNPADLFQATSVTVNAAGTIAYITAGGPQLVARCWCTDGTSTFGSAGSLHAVRVSDGVSLWRYQTPWPCAPLATDLGCGIPANFPTATGGLVHPPTLSRDGTHVFVALGELAYSGFYGNSGPGFPTDRMRTYSGTAFCFDALTGAEVWRSSSLPTATASNVVLSPDGSLVLLSSSEIVYALSATTGTTAWTYKVSEGPNKGVLFQGSREFPPSLGGPSYLIRVLPRTGHLLLLLVESGTTSYKAVALDIVSSPSSARVAWATQLPFLPNGRTYFSPNGALLISSCSALTAFDALNNGSTLWTIFPPAGLCFRSGPALTQGGAVVTYRNDGRLLHYSPCPAGFFCLPELAQPLPCSPGTVSPGDTRACVPCDAGRFQPMLMATNVSQCALCPRNSFSDGVGFAGCRPCPEDRPYTAREGAVASAECVSAVSSPSASPVAAGATPSATRTSSGSSSGTTSATATATASSTASSTASGSPVSSASAAPSESAESSSTASATASRSSPPTSTSSATRTPSRTPSTNPSPAAPSSVSPAAVSRRPWPSPSPVAADVAHSVPVSLEMVGVAAADLFTAEALSGVIRVLAAVVGAPEDAVTLRRALDTSGTMFVDDALGPSSRRLLSRALALSSSSSSSATLSFDVAYPSRAVADALATSIASNPSGFAAAVVNGLGDAALNPNASALFATAGVVVDSAAAEAAAALAAARRLAARVDVQEEKAFVLSDQVLFAAFCGVGGVLVGVLLTVFLMGRRGRKEATKAGGGSGEVAASSQPPALSPSTSTTSSSLLPVTPGASMRGVLSREHVLVPQKVAAATFSQPNPYVVVARRQTGPPGGPAAPAPATDAAQARDKGKPGTRARFFPSSMG
jgi:outer membrane protein assembly factor BamB